MVRICVLVRVLGGDVEPAEDDEEEGEGKV